MMGSAKMEHEQFRRLAQYLFYDSPNILVQTSFPFEQENGNDPSSLLWVREESLKSRLTQRGGRESWIHVGEVNSRKESSDTTGVFLTKKTTLLQREYDYREMRPHVMILKLPGLESAITAFYFPLDAVATRAELVTNGYLSREWTLCDEWRANDRFEGDMRMLSLRDDEPIEKTPADKMRHELEMDKLHLKSALSLGRESSSPTESYNRGPIVTMDGRRFQRCLPMDPCLPISLMNGVFSELRFDARVEILVEFCWLGLRLRSKWNEEVPFCLKGKQLSESRESEYYIVQRGCMLPIHIRFYLSRTGRIPS